MKKYYILGICTTEKCTENGGGWIEKESNNQDELKKYKQDYDDGTVELYNAICPECGEPLSFLIEERSVSELIQRKYIDNDRRGFKLKNKNDLQKIHEIVFDSIQGVKKFNQEAQENVL